MTGTERSVAHRSGSAALSARAKLDLLPRLHHGHPGFAGTFRLSQLPVRASNRRWRQRLRSARATVLIRKRFVAVEAATPFNVITDGSTTSGSPR